MPCESTRKRNKCDEECLDRIAARLRGLDAISGSSCRNETVACVASCCGEDVVAVDDDCCGADKPKTPDCGEIKAVKQSEGCCSGSGKATEVSGCCVPATKSSDGCCGEEKAAEGCSAGKESEKPVSGCCVTTAKQEKVICSKDRESAINDCCAAEKSAGAGPGCCGPKARPSGSGCSDGEDKSDCSFTKKTSTPSLISQNKSKDGCCSQDQGIAEGNCCSSKELEKPTSECCAPSQKLGATNCNDAKGDTGCISSHKADEPTSSCCAATTKQVGGCCSDRSVTDDCCSSVNAVLPRGHNCKSPKKSACLTEKISCGDNIPETSDRCSKVHEVTLQSLKDCSDGCCQETSQEVLTPQGPARADNFQTTMDRLEAMLRKGQCLCRRVQEQWGFNCCDPASAPAGVVARKRRASPAPSTQSSNSKEKVTVVSTATAIHSRCSFDAPNTTKNRKPEATQKAREHSADIEQDSAREHVVLDVSGMTCTGCSKKMTNVLNGITGLSNAQVTFVSGNAEFDLDPEVAGKAEDVILRVEKETGFKCSRLVSGVQELHVIMDPATAKEIADVLPAGVMSVVRDKKKSDNYYITYNTRVAGARSLLPPSANLAPPQDSVGVAEGKKRLISTAMSTTLAAVLTIPVVVLEWSDNPLPSRTVEIVALILGTGVQAIAIPEFYVGAIKSLVYSHVIEMDMLVVISITSAYLYSAVAFGLQRAGVNLEQGPFFETSTLLITLVLLGRLMAAWARMKALSSVSLRSLQAETALLIGKAGETSKIDARLLQFGDSIVVPPHSRIVTDGIVTEGASEVDESMVTGESLPVAKKKGDTLIAGTINGSGNLRVRLTRLPGENSITDIATLVENAVAAKPRVQDLADRVAGYFIPAVVGIAIVVFCIWIAVALEVRDRNGGGAVGRAITYAIAVLAISCPCALGLAVPMVLVIAGGVAARAGVVIKAADAIERSYKVTDVVFDKTGTLTEGDLQVVHMQALCSSTLTDAEILQLGKAVVDGNEHPVSVAVAAHFAEKAMPSSSKITLENVTSIPGAGIEAQYQGFLIKAGNPYWLSLENHPNITDLLQQAMTIFCITMNEQPILILGLKSTLRSNAASIIANLHARNVTTHIVSGDNPSAVLDIAHTLGIQESNIRSRSSPSQKQEYVHALQTTPDNKKRTVLFIGDGTNDAVAIAQSDIGVQMGSTSDVTGAVSDVVILSHDLSGLITLLDLSKRAVRRIQFNFVWSGVYNLFAILLASGAFVRVRIEPAYAGLGEIVSVGPVILAGVSLMWKGRF